MQICITKNNRIYALFSGEGTREDFDIQIFESVPNYPSESAGVGKDWELQIVDGKLEWVLKYRPLSNEETTEEPNEN